MITEDYVPFEIAKLLEEKGFNQFCEMSYDNILETHKLERSNNDRLNQVYAPTLQMAMKWIREVHYIDIEVLTYYLNYLKPNDIRYYSGKILKGSEDVIYTIYSKDTYEKVCEAGIKYCLENLI